MTTPPTPPPAQPPPPPPPQPPPHDPADDWSQARPEPTATATSSAAATAATTATGSTGTSTAQAELESQLRSLPPLETPWIHRRLLYRIPAVLLQAAGGGWLLYQANEMLSQPYMPSAYVSLFDVASLIGIALIPCALFSTRVWHRLGSAAATAGLGLLLTELFLFRFFQETAVKIWFVPAWMGPVSVDRGQAALEFGCALACAVGCFAALRLIRMESRRILDVTRPPAAAPADGWGDRPPPLPADRRKKLLRAIIGHRFLAMIPHLLTGLSIAGMLLDYRFLQFETKVGFGLLAATWLFIGWGLFSRVHTWRFLSGGVCLVVNLCLTLVMLPELFQQVALAFQWGWSTERGLAGAGVLLFFVAAFGTVYGAARLAWLETLLLPTRFKPPKQIEEEEANWAANWDHAKPGK